MKVKKALVLLLWGLSVVLGVLAICQIEILVTMGGAIICLVLASSLLLNIYLENRKLKEQENGELMG